MAPLAEVNAEGMGKGVTNSYLTFTNIKPLHKTTGFLTYKHFKSGGGGVLGFAEFVVASTKLRTS